MSMGFSGNFAVVIAEKIVSKAVPAEYKAFQKELRKLDGFLCVRRSPDKKDMNAAFAEFVAAFVAWDYAELDEGAPIEQFKKCRAALDALADAFKKATGIGLYVDFHYEENGDTYDEVSGAFWSLDFDDCFPASKALQALRKTAKEVRIKHFVRLC